MKKVINIQAKSKLLLWVIVVLMIIVIITGVLCCEHKSKQTIETDKQTIGITAEENKRIIEIESDKDGDTNQAVKPVSLGNFKLTAYCPCEICCGKWADNRPDGVVYGAIGEELKENYGIAVDPSVIPYRTEVIINGHIYKAQDCGGAIKGNRIDVYFEDHNKALEFGVQYAEVFVMPK